MPTTLIKTRFHCNKYKYENKQEMNNTKSNLPSNPQTFKQRLLSENGFLVFKWA